MGALAILLLVTAQAQCAIFTPGKVRPGSPEARSKLWNPELLAVGVSSDASLTVNNKSMLNTTTAEVALNTGSSARFQLSGPGSIWNNIRPINIENSGVADTLIEDDARVHIGGSVTIGR